MKSSQRDKAWSHFFRTQDKEPLIKAYWDSVRYIAERDFPQHEEMIQYGLLGVCKAAENIDMTRVGSVDAWVFLNAKNMMINALRKAKPTLSLEMPVAEDMTLGDTLFHEDDHSYMRFKSLIKSLSIKEQKILELLYVWGFNKREIGKMFGSTSVNPSANIHLIEKRALEKLRAAC